VHGRVGREESNHPRGSNGGVGKSSSKVAPRDYNSPTGGGKGCGLVERNAELPKGLPLVVLGDGLWTVPIGGLVADSGLYGYATVVSTP